MISEKEMVMYKNIILDKITKRKNPKQVCSKSGFFFFTWKFVEMLQQRALRVF